MSAVDTQRATSRRSHGTASRTNHHGTRMPLLPHVHTSDLQLADIDSAVRAPELAPSGRSPLNSRRGQRPHHHQGSQITSRMSGKTARAPSARSVLHMDDVQPPALTSAVPHKLPKIRAAGTGRDVASSWTFFTDVSCTTRRMGRPLKETGVPFVDEPLPSTARGTAAMGAALENARPAPLTAREFTHDAHLRKPRPVARVPEVGFLPAIASPATRTTVTAFFRSRSQAAAPGQARQGMPLEIPAATPPRDIAALASVSPGMNEKPPGSAAELSTSADGLLPMQPHPPGSHQCSEISPPGSVLPAPLPTETTKSKTRRPKRRTSPVRGYAALRHNPPLTGHEKLAPLGKGKPLPAVIEYLGTFNASRQGTAGSLAEATLGFDGDLRPQVTPPPTIDLTTSHAEQLQTVAGTCIDVLIGMAPLAEDERGYEEESLDVRVRLRDQYRGLHPVQHVTLASNVPTELRESVASVATRVPNPAGSGTVVAKTVVPVEWNRDPGVQQNVALMKPRGLDLKTVRGAVAQLSDPEVPVERGARLAYLRAKQKEAEAYFGIEADTMTNAERMSRRAGE
eukprot:CAMPEP_0174849128 /NCGR_PEP_ID=MMETSP1114-20130205/13911_1 /TAXON_ID=312471 /ORGANISM="Neobodo designis, Strain CCAP 1951/1" /LENGTH=568 /DNA_ID=CAMNT_0016083439 /DNA_START=30 /DNA_END=1733 /DNA_ORIENTATION=-